MTSSGDQVRVAIAGRGVLARRAEVVLRRRLGPRVAFVPRFDEAHAVLLAGSADAAARVLSGVTAGDPALYLDFSSHSRGRGVDAVRAVLHGEYVPPGRGIVSLPGCYASSVFSPLLHLEIGDHLRVRRLTAFSVGGRSTLGVSSTAALQPGRCRLASAGSARMHMDEVARAIGLDPSAVDLTIVVADLDDGILTRVRAELTEAVPARRQGRFALDVAAGGWCSELGGYVGLERWHPGDGCPAGFAFAVDGGRLDLAVQLHNLDFPLSVAAMYLTRALGRAAPG